MRSSIPKQLHEDLLFKSTILSHQKSVIPFIFIKMKYSNILSAEALSRLAFALFLKVSTTELASVGFLRSVYETDYATAGYVDNAPYLGIEVDASGTATAMTNNLGQLFFTKTDSPGRYRATFTAVEKVKVI